MPRSLPYDVFLSHNSVDKALVRALADWLQRNGVTCWLDETVLLPGDILTDKLGHAMEQSSSAIVCIGPEGEGPWMAEEINTLLNKAIKVSRQQNDFRIIPVLLPGANTADLRWFLKTRLWVDLTQGLTDNDAELLRLKAAILGERGTEVQLDSNLNPYRGLEAFQPENAPFFFGRTAECKDLAKRLRDSRFAVIVGPSGNGKSSLARAGLATEAAQSILSGVASWRRVIVTPGGHLLRSFLTQLYAALPDETRATTVDEALKRVRPVSNDGPTPAAAWAQGIDAELRSFYAKPGEKILIIIDQFEEIFTHRGLGTTTDDEHMTRIQRTLDGLVHLLKKGDPRWHLVIALRSDFEQRCRVSPGFWALLEKDHLRLPLDELEEDGWRAAIKGPAARAGAYLEEGLVESMVKDVFRQRGSMPLLQLALQSLWEKREGASLTHTAYTAIGGVANALQIRAESCLKLLKAEDPEHHEIARNLFLRLTSPGEGVSDTRRRLDKSELDWENTDPGKVEHVIKELSSTHNRLITTDREAVEVTHEVLIRDCASIRGWIEAVRSEIPPLRRLTHSARQWQAAGHAPERLRHTDSIQDLITWAGKTSLRLTSLERTFMDSLVKADHEAQKREIENKIRLKRAALTASIFASFTLLVAILALYNLYLAQRAQKAAAKATASAQQALVTSFVRTIGVQDYGSTSPAIEHEALWEVATLDHENEAVRKGLLQAWSTEGPLPYSPFIRTGTGLHAVTGLQPSRVPWLKFHHQIVQILRTPEKAGDDGIDSLAIALPDVITRLSPDEFDSAITAILQSLSSSQPDHLHYDLRCIIPLASRTNSDQSARVASHLLSMIEASLNETTQVSELLSALALFLERMTTPDRAALQASALKLTHTSLSSPAPPVPILLQLLDSFDSPHDKASIDSLQHARKAVLLHGIGQLDLEIGAFIGSLRDLPLEPDHPEVLRRAWLQTLILRGPQLVDISPAPLGSFGGHAVLLAGLQDLMSPDQAGWFAGIALNASLNHLEASPTLPEMEFEQTMSAITSLAPRIRQQALMPFLTRLIRYGTSTHGEYGWTTQMEERTSLALVELSKRLDAGQRAALIDLVTDTYVSPTPPERFPLRCFNNFIEDAAKGISPTDASTQRKKIARVFDKPGIPEGFRVDHSARLLVCFVKAGPSDEATKALSEAAHQLLLNGRTEAPDEASSYHQSLLDAHEIFVNQAGENDRKAMRLEALGLTTKLVKASTGKSAALDVLLRELGTTISRFPSNNFASEDQNPTPASSKLTSEEANSIGTMLLSFLLPQEISREREHYILVSLAHVLPAMEPLQASEIAGSAARAVLLSATSDEPKPGHRVSVASLIPHLSKETVAELALAVEKDLGENVHTATEEVLTIQLDHWKALTLRRLPLQEASQHIAAYVKAQLSTAPPGNMLIDRWMQFLTEWEAPLTPALSEAMDLAAQALAKSLGENHSVRALDVALAKHPESLSLQTNHAVALATSLQLKQPKAGYDEPVRLMQILFMSMKRLPQQHRVDILPPALTHLVDKITSNKASYELQSINATTLFADLASLDSSPAEASRWHARIASALLPALEEAETRWRYGEGASCLLQLTRRLPVKMNAVEHYALSAIFRAVGNQTASGEAVNQAHAILNAMTLDELVDVLKWPTCIGNNRNKVLQLLEEKTGGKFGNDLWRFVKAAPTLDLTEDTLKRAPARPTAGMAAKELEQFLNSSQL